MKKELVEKFAGPRIPAKAYIGIAVLLIANATFVPRTVAQIELSSGSRSTVFGTVFVEGTATPAVRVRVDVRALTGAEVATTYTDSGGRFQAPGPNSGPYIVSVEEPGYEPVEQQIGPNDAAGVVLTLRRAKTASNGASGYTVSVHDLNAPGKARKAFDKGLERLQKNDLAGSVLYFKEATDAFPDYYEAFYQLGVANLELRRSDEAERALQKAIDLSGGHNADPQFALGALLCDRQEYAEAEKVIRRGMEHDSNSWRGYLFLGQAQFGQNQLEQAEKNARIALSRKSDLASAYILLANVAIRRHDYRTAVTQLDKFLELKPDGANSAQARDVRNAAQRVLSRFSRMFSPPQFVY
jgi:Tfp pilus assembly protein PilF